MCVNRSNAYFGKVLDLHDDHPYCSEDFDPDEEWAGIYSYLECPEQTAKNADVQNRNIADKATSPDILFPAFMRRVADPACIRLPPAATPARSANSATAQPIATAPSANAAQPTYFQVR